MTTVQNRLVPLVILLIALGAYTAWLIVFLTNPATSWVHTEAAGGDVTLHKIMRFHWQTTASEIIRGIGIDSNLGRFRPISHAVEYLDSAMRHDVVAVVGFVPALSNVSSLVYFSIAPLLALLIARRLIGPTGPTVLGAFLIVLAVGAFLTSTGYLSASIFVFRPAKKLAIIVTLLQLMVVTCYLAAPKRRHLIALGALQCIGALTDETTLVVGIALPVLAVLGAASIRRTPLSHGLWLVPFWIATGLAFAFGQWIRNDLKSVHATPNLFDVLSWLVRPFDYYNIPGRHVGPESFADIVLSHLAGAFSALYGPPAAKLLFLLAILAAAGLALAVLLRGSRSSPATLAILLGIGLAMLAGAAILSVLLMQFGSMPYLSKFNYYYASLLPVFAFFVTCSAIGVARLADTRPTRLASAAVQIGIAAALALAIAANVRHFPALNRIEAVIHNNPYRHDAINRAGGSPDGIARILQCSRQDIERELNRNIGLLGIVHVTQYYETWPPPPFGGEKFIANILAMMLRQPPSISIVTGCGNQEAAGR